MSGWVSIKGFPNYEANSNGDVQTRERKVNHFRFNGNPNVFKPKKFKPKPVKYKENGKIVLKNTCFTKVLTRDEVLKLSHERD